MPIVFPVCLVMDVWLTKWCWYSFRPWGADKIDILTDFNCNSRSIAAVLPELQGSPWSCICWPFALWSCSCLDYLHHKSCEIISGEGIGWEWRGWRWNLAASCGSLSIGSTTTTCNQDWHIKWRSWKVEVFATCRVENGTGKSRPDRLRLPSKPTVNRFRRKNKKMGKQNGKTGGNGNGNGWGVFPTVFTVPVFSRENSRGNSRICRCRLC